MKVILTQNIKKLGNAGEVIDVANGFACNHLIPEGKAVVATPSEVLKATEYAKNRQISKSNLEEFGKHVVETLTGKTLLFVEKVSKDTHLFGSISEKDILAKIEKEFGIGLEKSHIGLDHHIKETGEHAVTIKIAEPYMVKLTIQVEEAK